MDVANVDFYVGEALLKSSWISHDSLRNLLLVKECTFEEKSYSPIRVVYKIDGEKYHFYLEANSGTKSSMDK